MVATQRFWEFLTPDPYSEMIQFDEQIFFQMGCNHQLRSVAVGISFAVRSFGF